MNGQEVLKSYESRTIINSKSTDVTMKDEQSDFVDESVDDMNCDMPLSLDDAALLNDDTVLGEGEVTEYNHASAPSFEPSYCLAKTENINAGGDMSSTVKAGVLTSSDTSKDIKDANAEPGKCALYNLGNTCFMNAGLQSLFANAALTNYMLSDYPHCGPQDTSLAAALYRLFEKVWAGGYSLVYPVEFKQVLAAQHPQFRDYAQHDCQEFLAVLLGTLHEQLNSAAKPPVQNNSLAAAKSLYTTEAACNLGSSNQFKLLLRSNNSRDVLEYTENLHASSSSAPGTPQRLVPSFPNFTTDDSNMSNMSAQSSDFEQTENLKQLTIESEGSVKLLSFRYFDPDLTFNNNASSNSDGPLGNLANPVKGTVQSDYGLENTTALSGLLTAKKSTTVDGISSMDVEIDPSGECSNDIMNNVTTLKRIPSLSDICNKDSRTLNTNVLAVDFMHELIATDSQKFMKPDNLNRPQESLNSQIIDTDPMALKDKVIINMRLKDTNIHANRKTKSKSSNRNCNVLQSFDDNPNFQSVKRMKFEGTEKNIKQQALCKVNVDKNFVLRAMSCDSNILQYSELLASIDSDSVSDAESVDGAVDSTALPSSSVDGAFYGDNAVFMGHDIEEADRAWAEYREENRSVLVDTFHGQFKSTVTCSVCHHLSVTYEAFMYLSVPLPHAMERQICVTYISKTAEPTRYCITLNKNDLVRQLREGLVFVVLTLPGDIILAEVQDARIIRVLDDNILLHYVSCSRSDIYAFEMSPPPPGPSPTTLPAMGGGDAQQSLTKVYCERSPHATSEGGTEMSQVESHASMRDIGCDASVNCPYKQPLEHGTHVKCGSENVLESGKQNENSNEVIVKSSESLDQHRTRVELKIDLKPVPMVAKSTSELRSCSDQEYLTRNETSSYPFKSILTDAVVTAPDANSASDALADVLYNHSSKDSADYRPSTTIMNNDVNLSNINILDEKNISKSFNNSLEFRYETNTEVSNEDYAHYDIESDDLHPPDLDPESSITDPEASTPDMESLPLIINNPNSGEDIFSNIGEWREDSPTLNLAATRDEGVGSWDDERAAMLWSSDVPISAESGSWDMPEGTGGGGGGSTNVVNQWRSCAICLEDHLDSFLLIHVSCGCTLCHSCLDMSMQHYGAQAFVCPMCASVMDPTKDFVSLATQTNQQCAERTLLVPVTFRYETEENGRAHQRLFGHPRLLYLPSEIDGETLYAYTSDITGYPANYNIVFTDSQGLHCSRCFYTDHCSGCVITRDTTVSLLPGDHLTLVLTDIDQQQLAMAGRIVSDASMKDLRSNEPLTLADCFQAFTQSEVLDEHNPWYCPHCCLNQKATKTITIWRYPDSLIIYLKRFVFHELSSTKIDTRVVFPVENLDLRDFISGPKTKRLNYDLTATVCHFGGVNAGHYTAYSKHPTSDVWWYYNDETVSQLTPKDDDFSSAYVLFYQRRGTQAPVNIPQCLLRHTASSSASAGPVSPHVRSTLNNDPDHRPLTGH